MEDFQFQQSETSHALPTHPPQSQETRLWWKHPTFMDGSHNSPMAGHTHESPQHMHLPDRFPIV